MKHFCLFLYSLLFLFSCQSNSNQNTEASTVISEEVVKSHATPLVKLHCEFMKGATEEMIYPEVEVSLFVGDKKYVIDTIYACGEILPDEYDTHNMPKSTLSACGAWYAGGGDYFYAVEERGKVVVFKGWLDEMQEDEGYHYEIVKRVQLDKKS